MSGVFVVAARRTAVAPRNGAFAAVEPAVLADAVIRAVCADAGIAAADIDEVVLGNALYGGGNPARVAALLAGLPEAMPASTIDTQCCAGLDAILMAAARIRAGEADAIVAGGLESFSRAPLRAHRPLDAQASPEPYDRPPFSPWPSRDPDMIPAAARLADEWDMPRAAQEAFAVESHRKALARGAVAGEIVPVAGLASDAFARRLSPALCARLPVLAGSASHGVTAATVAVEADAAAAVMLVSEAALKRLRPSGRTIRLVGGARRGGDPERPGLAPVAAARAVMQRSGVTLADITVAEIMEAFAVQAMIGAAALGLDPARLNPGGGALSRGHPIGASGAIVAVRLWHELQAAPSGAVALGAIAAAGGLGSAILLRAEEAP
ncbi:thiolase family protein [Bradyrhizobium sp. U87765 SZCCT0131]|uniref:thiolase family protein n=1 Tax=unclassified Bradyrhizobium TaxID=2631580 RepID=UPI001BABE66F|nr:MULTISPECIES: thiolase family protein [unclassified Bradyrhizobium]MBR1217042.1 thiolase family protein [Bradyrhizobium sp. U87765 SZCCT0131]MBR1259202.1 thiolase family protein [Bradyrhizobium sp. U87765 SZCCT0134]MBR1305343.1 thiolase family protein [Bradyrhizobium sp. U87765 SZCCT0110]MBR1321129.1 thiolase family protein [Bradyrhizobium sp. U87765 SZCCT0109]MBR1350217.1 thiolase family protein [Bradyrhizobium sp. U87765 SZCCT0048]